MIAIIHKETFFGDLLEFDLLAQNKHINQYQCKGFVYNDGSKIHTLEVRDSKPFVNWTTISIAKCIDMSSKQTLSEGVSKVSTVREYMQEGFKIYVYLFDSSWDAAINLLKHRKQVVKIAIAFPIGSQQYTSLQQVFKRQKCTQYQLQHASPTLWTTATFALNGYSFIYGRVIELLRAAIGAPDKPALNLSLITTRVKNLNWNHINEYYPWIDFAISPKLDGHHCVCVLQGGQLYILYEQRLEQFQYSSSNTSKQFDLQQLTIVEGERMADDVHVYDCIAFGGKNLVTVPYKERLEVVQQLRAFKCSGVTLIPVQKQFVGSVEGSKDILNQLRRSAQVQNLETDGFIFQQNLDYRNNAIFKWKPVDLCTIDFLVLSPLSPFVTNEQQSGLSAKAVEILKRVYATYRPDNQNTKDCLLYSSASYPWLQYFDALPGGRNANLVIEYNNVPHLPFMPSLKAATSHDPLQLCVFRPEKDLIKAINGTVCEFKYHQGEWIFYKHRTDKNRANALRTAESIYTYIMNPITQNDIIFPKE